jgi:hypothetical protein
VGLGWQADRVRGVVAQILKVQYTVAIGPCIPIPAHRQLLVLSILNSIPHLYCIDYVLSTLEKNVTWATPSLRIRVLVLSCCRHIRKALQRCEHIGKWKSPANQSNSSSRKTFGRSCSNVTSQPMNRLEMEWNAVPPPEWPSENRCIQTYSKMVELAGDTSLITSDKNQRKPHLINATGPLPCVGNKWSSREGSLCAYITFSQDSETYSILFGKYRSRRHLRAVKP